LVLITSVLCLCNFLLLPKKTFAYYTVVEVGENLFTNILTTEATTITAEATTVSKVKETILDAIAFSVVNTMIEKIADSTVDWINNGFEGGPGFITDFDGFLTDVGDQTLGDFIAGSPLAFLCSPFSLDIKIALSLQFGGEREARCTLSDAFDNVNNAIDDLGNNWSWSKWNNIVQPQNNAYGAYAESYANLTLRMAEAKDREIIKSNWGGGMLDFEKCEESTEQVDYETGIIYTVPGKCTTKTPGSLIQDTLGDTLTIGNKRLVISDEIDEIIGALLNQLFKAVFSEEGLLNSDPGGANNENFSELPAKIVDETRDDLINPAIATEKEYKVLKKQSLAMVNYAEAYLEALIDCWNSYLVNPSATPPTLTQQQVDAKIATAKKQIADILNPLWERLSSEITIANKNIKDLNLLLTKLAQATNPETGGANPADIQNIINDYNAMDLHDKIDVAKAEIEYNETIKPDMNAIIANILIDSAECTSGGGTFDQPVYIPPPENPENPDDPPIDPNAEFQAKAYTSVYEYSQTRYYCSDTPNDKFRVYPCGTPNPVTGKDQYQYKQTLSDFKNLYNFNDPKIRCQQAVGPCPADESQHYSVAAMVGGANDPYPQGYQMHFRVYIPVGATSSYMGLFVPETGNKDIAVVARFGQPPTGDYKPGKNITWEDMPTTDVGWKLEDLKTEDRFARRIGGHITLLGWRSPEPIERGGWLYIKVLYFDSSPTGIFLIQSNSLMDNIDDSGYLDWYNSTKWDDKGNPLPLVGFH